MSRSKPNGNTGVLAQFFRRDTAQALAAGKLQTFHAEHEWGLMRIIIHRAQLTEQTAQGLGRNGNDQHIRFEYVPQFGAECHALRQLEIIVAARLHEALHIL